VSGETTLVVAYLCMLVILPIAGYAVAVYRRRKFRKKILSAGRMIVNSGLRLAFAGIGAAAIKAAQEFEEALVRVSRELSAKPRVFLIACNHFEFYAWCRHVDLNPNDVTCLITMEHAFRYQFTHMDEFWETHRAWFHNPDYHDIVDRIRMFSPDAKIHRRLDERVEVEGPLKELW